MDGRGGGKGEGRGGEPSGIIGPTAIIDSFGDAFEGEDC